MPYVDVRCPYCKKLLFKAQGLGSYITIKCDDCKRVVTWPTLKASIAPTLPEAATSEMEKAEETSSIETGG